MKITFITTGGTIDKDYASCAGTYNFKISQPAIKEILKNINPNFEFEIIPTLKKDSLDLTNQDRQLILKTCQNTKNNKIIITHGTDTMTQTAQTLKTIQNKTIILVGSSKPQKFTNSDAPFNIGFALGALNLLPEGIYICMNGKIHKSNQCHKEKTTGQFIKN